MITTARTVGDGATRDVAGIYATLRKLILDCTLAPGTQISQLKLTEMLDVGRTPLREALRMLQQEGLIESRKNRRVRVADFHPAELDDLYGSRLMLEALGIAMTVPRLTREELAEIELAVGGLDEAAKTSDMSAFEAPHRRFHALLVMHAGESVRDHILAQAEMAERYRRIYQRENRQSMAVAAVQHREIFEACREQDAKLAAHRLAHHLAQTAVDISLHMAPVYEPTATRTALRLLLGGNGFVARGGSRRGME